MTAPTTAAESAGDAPTPPLRIPALSCDEGPRVTLVRARGDRRNVLVIGGDPRVRRPVLVALEQDGSVSRRYFADDPHAPPEPVRPFDADTTRLVQALQAREAAVLGADQVVDRFTTDVLGRRGARWREAVSTALLGDWNAPLMRDERLDPRIIGRLKGEAERLHRQLMPLWRRRTRGSRLLLLDTPLGDGLTLYDLVADRAAPERAGLERGGDDTRLVAVLSRLRPDERIVALAWAERGVTTWAEAALYAGAEDPVATGERVRRKLKRLAARHHARAAAAARTRAGAP
ncbi:hypothetical protein GCM10027168_49940 [Streptomyces capparidis]